MKKKLLVVGALSMAAFTAVGVTTMMATSGNILFADTSSSSKYTWMHYAKKAATKSEKGVREYWVNCNTHEVVFEEPETTSMGEATSYNTAGFAADDDRWIYNVTLDAKEVVMSETTKAFDLGSDYSGATITSMKAGTFDLGTDSSNLDVSLFAEDHSDDGVKSVEIDLNKDGKYYTLFFDTTFVTANISSIDDFITYVSPYTATTADGATTYIDTNKFGYYKLTADLDANGKIKYSSGNSQNGYFAGTFDGCGHTIKSPSNANHGLFSNLRFAVIKNLVVSDTWHSDDGYVCTFARHVFQTTLDNVTVKLAAGNSIVTAEGYTPTCKSGYGWISWHTFQSNTLKDCTFDASGFKLGSLFGWNGSMTMPTVTNCVVKAKSLTQAMYSQYLAGKDEAATFQPENVTLKDGEVAIPGLKFVQA